MNDRIHPIQTELWKVHRKDFVTSSQSTPSSVSHYRSSANARLRELSKLPVLLPACRAPDSSPFPYMWFEFGGFQLTNFRTTKRRELSVSCDTER